MGDQAFRGPLAVEAVVPEEAGADRLKTDVGGSSVGNVVVGRRGRLGMKNVALVPQLGQTRVDGLADLPGASRAAGNVDLYDLHQKPPCSQNGT